MEEMTTPSSPIAKEKDAPPESEAGPTTVVSPSPSTTPTATSKPKNGRSNGGNRKRHHDFVMQLHSLLQKEASLPTGEEPIGIGWDRSGETVVVFNKRTFEKRLFRDRPLLCQYETYQEWETSMKQLGFQLNYVKPTTAISNYFHLQEDPTSVRKFSHPLFQRSATKRELSLIVSKQEARDKKKKTTTTAKLEKVKAPPPAAINMSSSLSYVDLPSPKRTVMHDRQTHTPEDVQRERSRTESSKEVVAKGAPQLESATSMLNETTASIIGDSRQGFDTKQSPTQQRLDSPSKKCNTQPKLRVQRTTASETITTASSRRDSSQDLTIHHSLATTGEELQDGSVRTSLEASKLNEANATATTTTTKCCRDLDTKVSHTKTPDIPKALAPTPTTQRVTEIVAAASVDVTAPDIVTNKVTDDEEDDDDGGVVEDIDLDRIITEWKDKNPKVLLQKWNSWYGGENTFVARKLRLWRTSTTKNQVQNKRMVLVLMSGRGSAKTVDDLKGYTPQLRRETARCLVLEKLMTCQVHTLDKRTIKDDTVSPLYHQGDINDMRRMTSAGLLDEGQFDEIVMDYVWWENAYIQDRVKTAFFQDTIPKLLKSCKHGGSIFLPCTPYMFAQTVLAILKDPTEAEGGIEGNDLNHKEIELNLSAPAKHSWAASVSIQLLTKEEASSQISFWHATEVIRDMHYLMSKDPQCLTDNIGMGDGRGVTKALRQVCSSLSLISTDFVLAQYKRLKVKEPLFIRIFANTDDEKMDNQTPAGKRALAAITSSTVESSIGNLEIASSEEPAMKVPRIAGRFVGERVRMPWDTGDGKVEHFPGTVRAMNLVLGRETYEVEFFMDNSVFIFMADAVIEGMKLYRRWEWEHKSRIVAVERL